MDGKLPPEPGDSAAHDGAEEPEDEEIELYHLLERRGWSCGVHDPDFATPLEGTLHLERGLRHMLRLECEDESLNLDARRLSELRIELRDEFGSFGLALLDAASGEVLCTLVAANEEERGRVALVLGRLREDPRAFRVRRRALPLLGCLPTGCARSCTPGCAAAARGRPASAPPPPASPATAAAAGAAASAARGRSTSSSSRHSRSLRGSARTPGSGTGPAGAAGPPGAPDLEQARAHVQLLWERAARLQAGTRSSSFRRPSLASLGSLASRASERPAGPTPTRASEGLDAAGCGALLSRLLGGEMESTSGLASLFNDCTGGVGISFAEFWERFMQVSLALRLWTEPVLEKYLQDGNGMTLEKWRWFLVQVQDEERAVVEAAEAQLLTLSEPDVDGNGCMTLVGLSKYLCSTANSILRPQRCEVHQDMTRPLAEYWIASAHHVHADHTAVPPTGRADGEDSCASDGASGGAGDLGPLGATIRSGCRCLGLALVLDSDREEVCALLQQQRVSLSEVLHLIDEHGFEKTEFPLLLVLWLGLLPLSKCKEVPSMLKDALSLRLWRNTGTELPSPEEAVNHVIVILSPAMPGADPSLETEPHPALQCAPAAASNAQSCIEDSLDVLQAWESASREFVIWPGHSMRTQLPERAPEIQVVFIACDELPLMGASRQQQLLEYSKSSLTLVFPMAARCAPANFNAAGAWAAGVQMAALTLDAGSADAAVLAHLGRFMLDNGGCGYVLKPPHLRQGDSAGRAEAGGQAPIRLELRVLAARAADGGGEHAWPVGPTAVAVSVWGAAGDSARKAYRPVRPEGPVIVWPEAGPGADGAAPRPMDFSVASPSTAVLVMELLELETCEGGPRRAGFFAAPVDGLRQGLRWVQLWAQGQGGEARPTPRGSIAGLLVHVASMRLRRV